MLEQKENWFYCEKDENGKIVSHNDLKNFQFLKSRSEEQLLALRSGLLNELKESAGKTF